MAASRSEAVFWVGMVLGGTVSGLVVTNCTKDTTHKDLCPTILEQSHSAADSLAVFQKHEGCWEYVQRGQP